MPRFFFHSIADRREHDMVGTVLADQAMAKREAVRFAGAIIRDHPDLLTGERDYRVEVQDDRANVVFAITMRGSDLAEWTGSPLSNAVTVIHTPDFICADRTKSQPARPI